MGPEEGGHVRGWWPMVDCGGFISFPENRKVGAVFGVGSAGWLEDELVGEEDGEENEKEIDPSDGVEGAFPGPGADEDFFPVHLGCCEEVIGQE